MASKNSATTCASSLARKQIRFANWQGLFYPPRLDENGTVRGPAVFQARRFTPNGNVQIAHHRRETQRRERPRSRARWLQKSRGPLRKRELHHLVRGRSSRRALSPERAGREAGEMEFRESPYHSGRVRLEADREIESAL